MRKLLTTNYLLPTTTSVPTTHYLEARRRAAEADADPVLDVLLQRVLQGLVKGLFGRRQVQHDARVDL